MHLETLIESLKELESVRGWPMRADSYQGLLELYGQILSVAKNVGSAPSTNIGVRRESADRLFGMIQSF